MKKKEKNIEEANKRREEEEILLQKRVRAMYENGEVTYIKLIIPQTIRFVLTKKALVKPELFCLLNF